MPGESGLIVLDWHNGNRSVLSDSNKGVYLACRYKRHMKNFTVHT